MGRPNQLRGLNRRSRLTQGATFLSNILSNQVYDLVTNKFCAKSGTVNSDLGPLGPCLSFGAGGANYITLAPDINNLVSLDRVTVVWIRRKKDTTLRGTGNFGNYSGGNDGLMLMQAPWSDGNLYWNFGYGTTLTVTGQTWTSKQVDFFCITNGSQRGQEIWRNGVKIGAAAKQFRSIAATLPFRLGAYNAGLSDYEEVYQFGVFDREWTPDEIRQWFFDPWQLFEPDKVRTYASVSSPPVLTPGTGSIILTGGQPSLDVSTVSISPLSGTIVLTGGAPSISTGLAGVQLFPLEGSILLSGGAPTLTLPVDVSPGSGSIVITGLAPTMSTGADVAISPGSGQIVITGNAATINVSSAKTVKSKYFEASYFLAGVPSLTRSLDVTNDLGAFATQSRYVDASYYLAGVPQLIRFFDHTDDLEAYELETRYLDATSDLVAGPVSRGRFIDSTYDLQARETQVRYVDGTSDLQASISGQRYLDQSTDLNAYEARSRYLDATSDLAASGTTTRYFDSTYDLRALESSTRFADVTSDLTAYEAITRYTDFAYDLSAIHSLVRFTDVSSDLNAFEPRSRYADFVYDLPSGAASSVRYADFSSDLNAYESRTRGVDFTYDISAVRTEVRYADSSYDLSSGWAVSARYVDLTSDIVAYEGQAKSIDFTYDLAAAPASRTKFFELTYDLTAYEQRTRRVDFTYDLNVLGAQTRYVEAAYDIYVYGVKARYVDLTSDLLALKPAVRYADFAYDLLQFGAISRYVDFTYDLQADAALAAWAINLSTGGVVRYTNYSFDSLGPTFGCKDDGIYLLSGNTDNGTAISAQVVSGKLTLTDPENPKVYDDMVKNASDFWLTSNMSSVNLTVATESASATYAITPLQSTTIEPYKRVLGRGLHGRYWQFTLTNVSGSRGKITEMEFGHLPNSRRVR